ncbi:AraC family transcriptional regulator [Winogradskya humida]|nr:AraC family transcriptional regulator [Actinoplanes humidus]
MSVASTGAWTLEQNDRRLDFAATPVATMFAESTGFRVTPHRHPAWKIVLSLGGHVDVGYGPAGLTTGPGVIVPPQVAHSCAVSSAYVALLLEPWELAPADRPVPIDATRTKRILAAAGNPGAGADLAAARAEIVGLTGAGAPLEPRVEYAVNAIARDGSISEIAAEVGLSAPRLRVLVRGSVGIPLARLRLWARLRGAVAVLPGGPAAVVAVSAGFADQAHLVRTARGLLGRTPSELFR